MTTITEKPQGDDGVFLRAAEIIKGGGLVAFPTETVYGLGANAFDPLAVRKIYQAKGRPADNPLIIHISTERQLSSVAGRVTETARKLIDAFWPGPLTIILPKNEKIPGEVTGGLDTVAVRCPADKTALRFIEACGVPIAAPSANASGRPSPTEAAHVALDLSGKIDMIIDGGACDCGIESTIADVSAERPVILRPGYVTAGMIYEALGTMPHCAGYDGDKPPKAPGMKYAHYSPLASMTIVRGDLIKTTEYINSISEKAGAEKIGVLASDGTKALYKNAVVISAGNRDNPETIARNIFRCLRQFDFAGVKEIYSEAFYETELGRSVMNRLEKAAAYRIVELCTIRSEVNL